MSLALVLGLALSAHAADPWPAETWQESENLTSLHGNFTNNLSGAHWNPATRTLWVAVNGPGMFVALVRGEDDKFTIERREGKAGIWAPGGDLESLTQVDYNADRVTVLVEGAGYIRQYDTSVYGTVKLLRQWQITQHVPTASGGGSEGIAFVPDEWLTKRAFVGMDGQPYISTKGMGGLFFVAHQRGGHIYVFDCAPDSNTDHYVGRYATGRPESSGLEFDRSTGKLYVWHNTQGNFLEEVDLASTAVSGGRRLTQLREWRAPKGGNLESIALTPADSYEHEAFITDDDNQQGFGLMRYRQWNPNASTFAASVSASEDDASQGRRGVVALAGALTLPQLNLYQREGVRFRNVAIPAGSRITRAYIQFTTTDDVPAGLWIRGEKTVNAAPFTAAAKNVTSRRKTRAKVLWDAPSWTLGGEAGEAQRTKDLSTVVQEQIDQPGWQSGGPLVFIIAGRGHRPMATWDTDPAFAPKLYIEYEALGD